MAREQHDYDDIPGTFVFDAERSRQGYGINMFCMSLMKDENRKAFKANEAEYVKQFKLTPEQTEAVLKRNCTEFGLSEEDIDDALDALFSQAGLHRLYFLWRPVAADPDDDLVIEAAIASHSDFVITFNKRDFPESRRFGIECLYPKEFLILLKELP